MNQEPGTELPSRPPHRRISLRLPPVCRSSSARAVACSCRGVWLAATTRMARGEMAPPQARGTSPFEELGQRRSFELPPCLRRAEEAPGMVPLTGNLRVITVFSGHRGSPQIGSFSAKCCHSVATVEFTVPPSRCRRRYALAERTRNKVKRRLTDGAGHGVKPWFTPRYRYWERVPERSPFARKSRKLSRSRPNLSGARARASRLDHVRCPLEHRIGATRAAEQRGALWPSALRFTDELASSAIRVTSFRSQMIFCGLFKVDECMANGHRRESTGRGSVESLRRHGTACVLRRRPKATRKPERASIHLLI